MAITIGLRQASRLKEQRPHRAWAEVDTALATARAALEDTRRAVHGLRPQAMDDHLESAALTALGDAFSSETLQVDVAVEGDLAALSPSAGLVVYRTVQEGMTNLIKHSRASRATVRVDVGARGEVRVRVDDDGRGGACDGGSADGGDGIGLAGLRDRAVALGGHMTAGPGPRGFSLGVELPAGAGAERRSPAPSSDRL